jgi:N-methylhydantoinase B
MNNVLIGGPDGATGGPAGAFSYYETLAGGQGARPGQAGMSGVHTHMTNTLNTPVEALEAAYPLRILEYRLRDGTGGEGRWRGGDGLRRSYLILGDRATASLLTERRRHRPWGLDGGEPGAPGRNAVIRDGVETELPAKATIDLRRDDVLVIDTPGGGGFGSPER